MKKIGLWMAALTAVTVGGVYATWTFAENKAAGASTTANVAMTGVNSATEKGTLSVMVMGANGFTVAVDDSDNNHLPEIKKSGVVTVTFTPAATASQDVKDHGIDVQCVISYAAYEGGVATLEEWKYETTQIFKITNDSAAPILLEKDKATKKDGAFTWTIEAKDVGIDLTTEMQGVYIDTLKKYTDLNALLAKGHFVLTVNEKTA